MKIVYTNLREDDSGIKRSIRQFQVDFGRNADRQAPLREGWIRDERRGDRSTLPLDRGLSSGKPRADYDRGSREIDEDEALPQGATSLTPLGGPQVLRSLAGFYIRKFVETQMRTVENSRQRSLISILV
jgi:hypothetical protein